MRTWLIVVDAVLFVVTTAMAAHWARERAHWNRIGRRGGIGDDSST